MSEHDNNIIPRREFVKKLAATTAMVAVGGTLAVETDKSAEEGIFAPRSNPVGRFFPIYEIHEVKIFGIKRGGVSLQDYLHLPHLDVLFSELMGRIDSQADDYEVEIPSLRNQNTEVLPEGKHEENSGLAQLIGLARNDGTKIAYGDFNTVIKGGLAEIAPADVNFELAKVKFINEILPIIEACFGYGILVKLSYAPGLKDILSYFADEKKHATENANSQKKDRIPKPKTSITRRFFLKTAGIGAATWLFSPSITSLVAKIATDFKTDEPLLRSLKHVLTRLDGIQSKFHPELLRSFVTDIIWGIKFLTLAEEEGKGLGRLPNIGFHTGGGHSGVEDWLILGKEFAYQVIELFPSSYLKFLSEANKGSVNIASVRLLGISPDGKKSTMRTIVDKKLKDIIDHKIYDIK